MTDRTLRSMVMPTSSKLPLDRGDELDYKANSDTFLEIGLNDPVEHAGTADGRGSAGATQRRMRVSPKHLLGIPAFWFAAFLLVVVIGLSLPLRLPIGPYYWDTEVYLDAIYRLRLGQIPSLDFFAPVGPLGYWLAMEIQTVFPNAQAMLLANWAVLPVALPVMALIIREVESRSRKDALLLLLPFLLFALFPVNLYGLYPSAPGFDGYGHYNRHIALLLYLLVTSMLFLRSRMLLTGLITALMLALVLFKITGAVAGTMIVGYGVLVGRLRLRDAGLVAMLVLAALGVLDLLTGGMVQAYFRDILLLISMNSGTLLPRFLTVASMHFNVIGPCLVLIGALVVAAWRDSHDLSPVRLRSLAASPLGWFATVFAALTLFETQNTGSLEFFGLWPVLLLNLMEWWRRRDHPMRSLVLILLMATTLPSLVIYLERSARAVVIAPTYVKLDLPDLGTIGRVSLKPELLERAHVMLDNYATHQKNYLDLVKAGQVPSTILHSEPDDQATWLLETQQGADAIRAWEAANHRRLASLFTLDFVDPLNWVLGRIPPRHVPIGNDPSRTNPPLTAATLAALAATDAILSPKCPPTTGRQLIESHFAPALRGRTMVALAPCWDMYLRP